MGVFTLNRVFLVVLVASLVRPIYYSLNILGVFHKDLVSSLFTDNDEKFRLIPDTVHCEDMHYWAATNQIFTACEDEALPRFRWFPPISHVDGPPATTGSIHVIDPETMKSTRLAFENFAGPFVTHGIDVIADPEKPDAVYIFAVNHLGNPDWSPDQKDAETHPARSQIEIFRHVLKSKTIRHLRSVLHPLITTPNDIHAQSPSSFWVTNDHAYRGGFMRHVEDLVPFLIRTNIIHVQLDHLRATEAEDGVDAVIALNQIFNNNGMGHGSSQDEILINSALGGVMYRAHVNDDHRTISVVEEVPVNSFIDNPSYYADPYSSSTSGNASGYVHAGIRKPIDFAKTHADPTGKDGVTVWYLRPGTNGKWERRLLFEDDGINIRSASSAVLVPIKPRGDSAPKEAWLFVTGFISNSAIAVKVEL